jgi:hypothetical protein
MTGPFCRAFVRRREVPVPFFNGLKYLGDLGRRIVGWPASGLWGPMDGRQNAWGGGQIGVKRTGGVRFREQNRLEGEIQMRTRIGLLGLVVGGLIVGLLASNTAVWADAATPGKHHHHHHIHGKIVSVTATSITVKMHHHHKQGGAAAAVAPETKTFQINASTKVEIVSQTGKAAGAVADLKAGEHVAIGEHEGVAHEIAIGEHPHHHHKKPVA